MGGEHLPETNNGAQRERQWRWEARWLEMLPGMHGDLAPVPSTTESQGVVLHTCIPHTGRRVAEAEGSVRGHPQIVCEFEASLGCVRPWV